MATPIAALAPLFAQQSTPDQQAGSLAVFALLVWGFVAFRRRWADWQVRRTVRAAAQAQQAYFSDSAAVPRIEGVTRLSQRPRAGDDLDHLPERIHARLDPRLRKFLGGPREIDDGA